MRYKQLVKGTNKKYGFLHVPLTLSPVADRGLNEKYCL